jgi:purine-binding chemotaxis protein CheW
MTAFATAAAANPNSPAGGRATDEIQLVVFELGDERYGLDIGSVYEIIRHQPITAVPQSAQFVEGVINLRGRINPGLSLREGVALAPSQPTKASRIVVCEAAGTRVGLIVDGVSEVLMVPAASIEPTPDVASATETGYLLGIALTGDRLVILLDLDGLFAEIGVASIAETTAA